MPHSLAHSSSSMAMTAIDISIVCFVIDSFSIMVAIDVIVTSGVTVAGVMTVEPKSKR